VSFCLAALVVVVATFVLACVDDDRDVSREDSEGRNSEKHVFSALATPCLLVKMVIERAG